MSRYSYRDRHVDSENGGDHDKDTCRQEDAQAHLLPKRHAGSTDNLLPALSTYHINTYLIDSCWVGFDDLLVAGLEQGKYL